MAKEDFKTVGAILKSKREEKNYSISEVSKLTNIPEKHIIALEKNDFEKLPAQIHVKGFIRLYADFLGIDQNYIIDLLNFQLKMEEKPPLNEIASIVKNDSSINRNKKLIIISGFIVITIIFVIFIMFNKGSTIETRNSDINTTDVNKVFDEEQREILVEKGELFKIKFKEKEISIKLNEISESIVSIYFIGDNRNIILKVNEYLFCDVDNDTFFDLGIYIKNIDDNRVRLGVDYINEKRLVKENFSVGIKKETNLVSSSIKLKILNKSNTKVFLFIDSENGVNETELTEQIEIDLIKDSKLSVSRIGFSNISQVDLFLNNEKLVFSVIPGSIGYIEFKLQDVNNETRLVWRVNS